MIPVLRHSIYLCIMPVGNTDLLEIVGENFVVKEKVADPV
jgi:hypothetical protein